MGRKNLTPYQGSKRCLGHFYCSDCDNKWLSAFSWSNKGQECLECEDMIYPHIQLKLKKKKENKQKRHLQEHCEMCSDLGYSCQKLNDKQKKKSPRR